MLRGVEKRRGLTAERIHEEPCGEEHANGKQDHREVGEHSRVHRAGVSGHGFKLLQGRAQVHHGKVHIHHHISIWIQGSLDCSIGPPFVTIGSFQTQFTVLCSLHLYQCNYGGQLEGTKPAKLKFKLPY